MVILNKSRKMFSLFILLLFIGITSLQFIQVDAASGMVTYTGYVRDTSSNPISGATVRLTINDDMVPVYNDDTTSATGYYSVTTSYSTATPPVDISLSATATNYAYDSYGATVNPGSYTHNFNLVYTGPPPPTVGWVSPANNEIITFTPSNNLFNFTYSAGDIDYTRLYMGPAGSSPTIQFGTDYTNEGSFIDKTVDIGVHMGDLHGLVRADLRAYVGGSVAVTSTRTFNFSKIISIETEFIEETRDYIGNLLTYILYDPPGDQSYSTTTTETKLVIRNTIQLEAGIGAEIHLGVEDFFVNANSKVEVDVTVGGELEWGTTYSDIHELTSSLNTDDRDLVGPGYGDLYYGELEYLLTKIYGDKITYSDSTVTYSNPVIYAAVDYTQSALVSHQYAPEEWKQQNPNINTTLYDDSNVVHWVENNSEIQGGTGARDVTHEFINNNNSWGWSLTVSASYSTSAKFGFASTGIVIHGQYHYEYDAEQTDSLKTQFHIYDDDSCDYFHYDVGTDLRYGTPIFRNTPNVFPAISNSSTPWEHNTLDGLKPETTYPVFTPNTDGDSYSPSEGDTPLVELTITDESNISVASLFYSHDGGAHWNLVGMTERLGEPDSWYANLPSHEHGSEVLWYVFTLI